MGNAKSTQDHYEVLGVNPDATETRITKAFRGAALKWHPVRRTPGDIGEAYRVLTDPIGRTAYNASRGSGRGRKGKGLFFYTGIVVVGYVTYMLWRSRKLEEKSQTGIEKIGIIIDWATKVSDAASALGSQLTSFASSVATKVKDSNAASASGSLITSWASSVATKVKDFNAASASGSLITSWASSVASASKDGMSKAPKWFQN